MLIPINHRESMPCIGPLRTIYGGYRAALVEKAPGNMGVVLAQAECQMVVSEVIFLRQEPSIAMRNLRIVKELNAP